MTDYIHLTVVQHIGDRRHLTVIKHIGDRQHLTVVKHIGDGLHLTAVKHIGDRLHLTMVKHIGNLNCTDTFDSGILLTFIETFNSGSAQHKLLTQHAYLYTYTATLILLPSCSYHIIYRTRGWVNTDQGLYLGTCTYH